MTNPFLGELALVPYNFAPTGWALCNGQLLPISQNTALFSLLGTTFGGDGKSTFALPDLRGRVPISSGQGPGLEGYALGQKGGCERVALSPAEMPAHSHPLKAHDGKSNTNSPTGHVLANGNIYSSEPADTSAVAVGDAGANQPHENRQPYLTLNWIIALQGTWPNRA